MDVEDFPFRPRTKESDICINHHAPITLLFFTTYADTSDTK